MELSSPRFKAVAVSSGLSFWFFIITNSFGVFSIENTILFIVGVFVVTQILAQKLSRVLDIFAIINTKIFLGILFIFIISVYGILFKLLKIDLLRLRNESDTYWLDMESLKLHRILKQY
jgi:hypothetical protein